VYDIFWVFGTDVMVTVAKSFEAPAKIIFPISFKPFQQSILGLGDIVIPGIFISMVLRFDFWLDGKGKDVGQETTSKENENDSKQSEIVRNKESINHNVDIHQRFSKLYFWCVMAAYLVGLLTTNIVMVIYKHPQPALLYLVPFCLAGLNVPACVLSQLHDVYSFSEENPKDEKPKSDEQSDDAKALKTD